MKILCLGDIAGPAACNTVCKNLWKLRKNFGIDFTVVNAENCAEGNGIDRESAEKLFICGADVITTGNHIWKKKEIRTYLDECGDILKPMNYSALENGFGYTIKECGDARILVMNAVGTVYMSDGIENPIASVEHVLEKNKGLYDISILDFHAEATSEKYAVGRYFDGKIDLIFGTHTHVQTADERILPDGSAYITDLGMCGSDLSILGVKSDIIIERYLGTEGKRFIFDDRNIVLCGIIFETDPTGLGKNKKIQRIRLTEDDLNGK